MSIAEKTKYNIGDKRR